MAWQLSVKNMKILRKDKNDYSYKCQWLFMSHDQKYNKPNTWYDIDRI